MNRREFFARFGLLPVAAPAPPSRKSRARIQFERLAGMLAGGYQSNVTYDEVLIEVGETFREIVDELDAIEGRKP